MALTDTQRLDAYRGTGGYADGSYLIQHVRESDEKFSRRKDLAKYLNYPQKIINDYLGTLYGHPAQRAGDSATWQALQANADGIGGKIDDFMLRATLLSMVLGTVYLVVDRPAGVSQSRADDLARLPYVVIRKPADVASMTLNGLGALERIVFSEAGRVTVFGSADPAVTAADTATRYRGYDRLRWWVSADAAGQQILTGPDGAPLTGEHGIGEVPVVRYHSTVLASPTEERATPWAEGILALADDLFNQWSEKRDLFRSQTFSVLTLPFADQSELDRVRETGLSVGTENALPYNPAGGGKPEYLAPPEGPAKQYQDDIDGTVKRLYELANLEFIGGVQQSGVAVAFFFQAANYTLGLLAQGAEQAELAVATLACRWNGEEPADDMRVVYPRQFSVEDLSARLKEDLDALSLDLGATAERLIRSRAARRSLGDAASPADYEQIDTELERGADPYQDRVAAEAVGAA